MSLRALVVIVVALAARGRHTDGAGIFDLGLTRGEVRKVAQTNTRALRNATSR